MNIRIKKHINHLPCILLATFLSACDEFKIPAAPFIVTEIDACDICSAKYRYKINSLKTPKSYTVILSDDKYHIGDTVRISKN